MCDGIVVAGVFLTAGDAKVRRGPQRGMGSSRAMPPLRTFASLGVLGGEKNVRDDLTGAQ